MDDINNAATPTAPEPALDTSFANDLGAPTTPTAPAVTTNDKPAPSAPTIEDAELLTIKQEALQQITPLINHLDQTPEEKFRTTMMMIQSADNKSLIRSAYETAKQITDDKIRAQALLDIVNEINYFTQKNK